MGLMAAFVGVLVALLFLRNRLNRLLYRNLLRLTGNNKVATSIYALLFLPGVILHEGSHWIAAKLLRVRTYHFSLTPEWIGEGTLRFGYVALSETDKLRSALIGLAPILSGTTLVTWLGFHHLKLDVVSEGIKIADGQRVLEGIKAFFGTPDVFLWCFLIFAVSNTMLPSASDREAWLPAMLLFALLLVAVHFLKWATAMDWIMVQGRQMIEVGIKGFGLSALLNLMLILPLGLADRLLR